MHTPDICFVPLLYFPPFFGKNSTKHIAQSQLLCLFDDCFFYFLCIFCLRVQYRENSTKGMCHSSLLPFLHVYTPIHGHAVLLICCTRCKYLILLSPIFFSFCRIPPPVNELQCTSTLVFAPPGNCHINRCPIYIVCIIPMHFPRS